MKQPTLSLNRCPILILICSIACNEPGDVLSLHSLDDGVVSVPGDGGLTAEDRTDRAVPMSADSLVTPVQADAASISIPDGNLQDSGPDTSLSDGSLETDLEHIGDVELPVVDHTQMVNEILEPFEGALPNPERGFYTHVEKVYSVQSNTPIAPSVLSTAKLSGHRLVSLIVDLNRFRASDVPASVLMALNADFEAIRSAGFKCILRFRYTASSAVPYGDADPMQVERHLEQLTSVLRENSDIIFTLQAGFIGAWGEWYYTDNWGDLGTWSEENLIDRRRLVTHLLDILPVSRTVQLRTPRYRTELFGAVHECGEGTVRSRIGQHNDCFLASVTDFGTYQNTSLEYPWLEENTRCVPMGGETCAVSGERSGCASALDELRRFHWTYLNHAYHPEVLANWSTQGCFETIRDHLGYRLTLDEFAHSGQAGAGGPMRFEFSGRNLGYAAPVNPRQVALILTAQSDMRQWKVILDVEPRRWLSSFEIVTDVGIPQDMPAGTYEVALSLADPEPALNHRSDYAIQLANEGIYDSETGMHHFATRLRVVAPSASAYTGSTWFEPYRHD